MSDSQIGPREIQPLANPIEAVVAIPGSKSHTNRALVCAAMADGTSRLSGVLFADDTEAMMTALETVGAAVRRVGSATVEVDGNRSDLDRASVVTVDARQSGTTSRFLLPLLANLPGRFRLDGHPQMRDRPFGAQLSALRSLGATIEGESLPFAISGAPLAGGTATVDSEISSQFLSGLLLAAPLAEGPISIVVAGDLVSRPYVRLTLDTMAAFGVRVDAVSDLHRFECQPGRYQPKDLNIEPDASAASYFFAAAAICGGTVRVEGLDSSTIQGDARFADVLGQMGAEVKRGAGWTEVTGTGTIQGISVDMSDISDTAQTLAVVACFAQTPTEISGIGFIRNKETDRVKAVVTELQRRGIDAVETKDGWRITPGAPTPGLVRTYDDHRMAMSFSLLGLRHRGIEIENPGCVAKTFPEFFETLDVLRS